MEGDPYSPAEMAKRVEAGGVTKAHLRTSALLMLAVLAGAFIALGAMLATIALTSTELGYGPSRLLAGVAFSLGLVLVVVGGAELFTGNALIVMAWADKRVTTLELARNWTLAYVGNLVGAVSTAVGVHLSSVHALAGGRLAELTVEIAQAKVALGFREALFRGAYCNALVCLAVWLGFSARTTTDKILCIVFPITAFVAAGFEHSIANMYLIPKGMLLQGEGGGITWEDCLLRNLLPVTLGNIVGGSLMVAAVYWFIYLRKAR
jgi:formate/nitrite transporter